MTQRAIRGICRSIDDIGLVEDEDFQLDQAGVCLALLDHPDVDFGQSEELLLAVAKRASIVGRHAIGGLEQATALSHVLGKEFGFAGDECTYNDPANADLIRVIERRRGLPVSLSVLYVATARRLGWIGNVLDVPGRALVLVGEDESAAIVDPFHGGSLVSSDELTARVLASDHAYASAHHVAAMTNRAILVRLLASQAARAGQVGMVARSLELYVRMTLIAPCYGHAWWQRSRLEHMLGDVSAARRSLAAMLEITRECQVRRMVAERLSTLPAR